MAKSNITTEGAKEIAEFDWSREPVGIGDQYAGSSEENLASYHSGAVVTSVLQYLVCKGKTVFGSSASESSTFEF